MKFQGVSSKRHAEAVPFVFAFKSLMLMGLTLAVQGCALPEKNVVWLSADKCYVKRV